MYPGRIAVCLILLAGSVLAAEPLRSGLQVGDRLPGSFQPLNLTGPHAGEEHCLVCEFGLNPVVMIFARDVNDPLVSLLAKLDAAAVAHKASELSGFLVLLSEKEDVRKKLPEIAKKKGFKEIVLSADAPTGPDGYKLAENAEVTVVLYHRHVVKANHAFKKDELNEKAVERILADVPKILPKK
jgi:hypothetical protein